MWPNSSCRVVAIFAVGSHRCRPPVLPPEIVVLEPAGRAKIRDGVCETGCRTGEKGWCGVVERAGCTVSLTGVYKM